MLWVLYLAVWFSIVGYACSYIPSVFRWFVQVYRAKRKTQVVVKAIPVILLSLIIVQSYYFLSDVTNVWQHAVLTPALRWSNRETCEIEFPRTGYTHSVVDASRATLWYRDMPSEVIQSLTSNQTTSQQEKKKPTFLRHMGKNFFNWENELAPPPSSSSGSTIKKTTEFFTFGPDEVNADNGIQITEQNWRNLRIGILHVVGLTKGGSWNAKLLQRIKNNHADYCTRHGYTLLPTQYIESSSRPVAWGKLPTIKSFLETGNFDYIFYLDMDTIITNPEIPLETFILLHPTAHMIFASDWNGLNSGLWLTKNTPFSKFFLEKAYEQEDLVSEFNKNGVAYPFEYEQRALHYMINSDVWAYRGLTPYPYWKQIRPLVVSLTQCAMNSYVLVRSGLFWHSEAQFASGDFILHFAGKKGDQKMLLMEHYLKKYGY